MAIFSRRILQRLINENGRWLKESQTKKHVRELNQAQKEPTLAFEWEVVLVNVFSKLGKVRHEEPLGNGKDADIYFETFSNSDHNFTADITTASDKGLDENNPFEALSNELTKRVSAAGLKPNYFDLKVDGVGFPTFKGGPKIKLTLPGRARFDQIIFNQGFEDFLSVIASNPGIPLVHRINNADADVSISYQPGKRFGSGSFPSYSEVFRITENTIYTALESKARKLDEASLAGPFGILLCDNGCSLFHHTPTAGLSYSMKEVIQHFLKNNPEIAFVATFTTYQKNPYSSSPMESNPYLPDVKLYRGVNFDSQVPFDLSTIFSEILDRLPEPESTPSNAINHLKGGHPQTGRSNNGGMKVSYGDKRMTIEISARALLELLAGKVDQQEFFEMHRFVPSEIFSPPYINPFFNGIEKGQLIDEISIQKSDTEDDDWITFELSIPDPAISPLVAPSKDAGGVKKT